MGVCELIHPLTNCACWLSGIDAHKAIACEVLVAPSLVLDLNQQVSLRLNLWKVLAGMYTIIFGKWLALPAWERQMRLQLSLMRDFMSELLIIIQGIFQSKGSARKVLHKSGLLCL